MTVFKLCAVLLSLVSCVSSTKVSPDHEGSGDATPAFVYYCSDGDTCRVKFASGSMWTNVRLAGIDAPETPKHRGQKQGQPLGTSAKDELNQLIQGREVRLIQTDLDPYNRPIVEIFLGSQSVNITMVEKGLAEVYRGKTKRIDRKKFEDAENQAKQNKIGIWLEPHHQSPSDFRKSQE